MPIAIRKEGQIPRKLLSGQQLNGGHWHKRQKDRKIWFTEIAILFGSPPVGYTPKKVVIEITRVLAAREREYDEDNLRYGSAKQIVDAFVRLGWARDDNPSAITVVYRQLKETPRPKTPLVKVDLYAEPL
jgi:hypothetical protein